MRKIASEQKQYVRARKKGLYNKNQYLISPYLFVRLLYILLEIEWGKIDFVADFGIAQGSKISPAAARIRTKLIS